MVSHQHPPPLLTPQLHAGSNAEADVLTECLALPPLQACTQLTASDGKGGRALGQELLPGMCVGRQGQGTTWEGPFSAIPSRGRAMRLRGALQVGYPLLWVWLPPCCQLQASPSSSPRDSCHESVFLHTPPRLVLGLLRASCPSLRVQAPEHSAPSAFSGHSPLRQFLSFL